MPSHEHFPGDVLERSERDFARPAWCATSCCATGSAPAARASAWSVSAGPQPRSPYAPNPAGIQHELRIRRELASSSPDSRPRSGRCGSSVGGSVVSGVACACDRRGSSRSWRVHGSQQPRGRMLLTSTRTVSCRCIGPAGALPGDSSKSACESLCVTTRARMMARASWWSATARC
jgi:hypothetical protein